MYVVGDGFYWDDMTVTVIDLATGVDDNIGNGGSVETQNIASLRILPNPASGNVKFNYTLDKFAAGNTGMKIYDMRGQQVFETGLPGESGEIEMDISSWGPGMYFYALSLNGAVIRSGKFIVR